MQYDFPDRFIRPLGSFVPGPEVYHPDLKCQFLVDDQRIVTVKASNAQVAAKLCLRELKVGKDTLLGFRWNDQPISPYIKLKDRLNFDISLDRLEQIFETQAQIENQDKNPLPDLGECFRKMTGRMPKAWELSALSSWWINPETDFGQLDEVCILKMIDAPGGGKRVITPVGHTISKTDAYAIYMAVMGYIDAYTRQTARMPHRVRVREPISKNCWTSPQYHLMKWDGVNLRIGCQTIPRFVIEEFGKREGWKK